MFEKSNQKLLESCEMLENETLKFYIWVFEVMNQFVIPVLAASLPWAHVVRMLCLTIRGSK